MSDELECDPGHFRCVKDHPLHCCHTAHTAYARDDQGRLYVGWVCDGCGKTGEVWMPVREKR